MSSNLTRRSLLTGLAGAAGGAVLLGLTGCQSAVSQQSSGSDGKGGTFHGGITSDLVPANFYTNSNAGVTTIIGLVYESLVSYRVDRLEAEPQLATSWKISDDGLTVTLQLRRGVKFHSGRAFTSKDVEFSLKTYADPRWTGQMQSTAAAITAYDTSDPHTAVLHLDHPMSNIIDLLDIVPIVDQETFDGISDGSTYVGTGPFTFEKWSPGSGLEFAKFDDYWVDGRPYLDAVSIAVVTDASGLANQLRSGQLDYAYGVSYKDGASLTKDGQFDLHQLTGAEEQIYVGANREVPGLDDLRVRQAIAYGLDRERIMSEVFLGSGYAVNLPWPKYSSAYDEKLNRTYGHDVAKAKALLADYGKQVPPVTLTYSVPSPVYEATAQIIQENLKEIGITVKLDPVDPPSFVAQLIGAKFKGLWTTFHSWAHYTPSTLNVSAYPFNALHNASHYTDAGYTKDAQAAWTEVDGTGPKAVAAYAEVSQDLLDALFLIEIGVVEDRWITSPKVQGLAYTKNRELTLTDARLG